MIQNRVMGVLHGLRTSVKASVVVNVIYIKYI